MAESGVGRRFQPEPTATHAVRVAAGSPRGKSPASPTGWNTRTTCVTRSGNPSRLRWRARGASSPDRCPCHGDAALLSDSCPVIQNFERHAASETGLWRRRVVARVPRVSTKSLPCRSVNRGGRRFHSRASKIRRRPPPKEKICNYGEQQSVHYQLRQRVEGTEDDVVGDPNQ